MKIYLQPSKLSSIRRRLGQSLRPFIVIASLAIVALLVPVTQAAVNRSLTPDNYKQQLVNQVQTSGGAPKYGHDPAVQAQTSLVSVASRPNSGIGGRVDHLAAGLVSMQRRINPTDVLPDIKKTGISVSGCLIDYGTPGTQCLPAKAPNNQPLTCDFVRTMFPKGVAINGDDHLHLSTGSNIACDN